MDLETAMMLIDAIACIWVFPKIGVSQNGWFIMDDLGVPLFLETPICLYTNFYLLAS